MTSGRALAELLDDIEMLELDDDEVDDYPWHDAWSWSQTPDPWIRDYEPDPDLDIPPPRVTSNAHRAVGNLAELELSVSLTDGRTASWSLTDGWSGDAGLIAAAQAVAGLHPNLPTMTAVARGMVGIVGDGRANSAVWLAARL